ncbi:hypothetical protein Tco_1154602 [Tanacetum coccineum]
MGRCMRYRMLGYKVSAQEREVAGPSSHVAGGSDVSYAFCTQGGESCALLCELETLGTHKRWGNGAGVGRLGGLVLCGGLVGVGLWFEVLGFGGGLGGRCWWWSGVGRLVVGGWLVWVVGCGRGWGGGGVGCGGLVVWFWWKGMVGWGGGLGGLGLEGGTGVGWWWDVVEVMGGAGMGG